jgi:hypothetical protein
MLSRPPSTITTPEARRTPAPKRFSKSSGSVMTPASRSGLMQKPVAPTTNMASAIRIPGVAPAKPKRYPASAVYMQVTIPNSVAASEAMPRCTSISRPATRKSSTPPT